MGLWPDSPRCRSGHLALAARPTHPLIPSRGMKATPGYHESKDAQLKRLRRIEGQVRGLQRLVENDTYCIDVLTQVSAATRALESFALGMLDEHLAHCVADATGPSAAVVAAGAPARHAAAPRLMPRSRRRRRQSPAWCARSPTGFGRPVRAWRLARPKAGQAPGRMFTARAAISATVTSEIAACRANSSFAQRESGNVSVGENAVELVNDTYR